MKNPLQSIRKLRHKGRRASTIEGEAASQTLDTSPESDVSTPAQSLTPNASVTEDRESPDYRLSSEGDHSKKKLATGLLKKAKAAVTKSVKFASTGEAAKTVTTSPTKRQDPVPEQQASLDDTLEAASSEKESIEHENGIENEDPVSPPVTSEVTSVTHNPPPEESPLLPDVPSEADRMGDERNRPDEKTEPESSEVVETVAPTTTGRSMPVESVQKTETSPEVKESKPRPDAEAKVYDVDGGTVVWTILGIVALLWMLIFWIFGVNKLEMLWWSITGFVASVGYCYLYGKNIEAKKTRSEIFDVTPGVAGLRSMLTHVPTWLSYTRTERVEWLNKAMKQMWPAYDKAVCEAIKESVEPIIQSVKPPIFKDIRFTRLRFGDVPFRIEGVEIFDITENEIVLDIDIRWCGDSNITLAIEPNIPSMTSVASSELLHSAFQGGDENAAENDEHQFLRDVEIDFQTPCGRDARIRCDRCYVRSDARRSIQYRFRSRVGRQRQRQLGQDGPRQFHQRHVGQYNEDVTGPIEDLQLRHVGILTVKVLEARNLPAADMNGTSDPTIELWTRPERKYNTAVMKKTLNPVWDNEIHNLLVQEPRSQNMCLTASDVDFLNVTDVFKSLNIVKNLREAIYAKEFLGRTMVSIRPAADRPGEEIDQWYDLGSNAFGHPDGTGTGCGRIHLKMIYTPFSMLDTLNSTTGAVIVTVVRCRDLVAMDRCGTSDPYVRIKLQDKTVKTHVVNTSCDPEFHSFFEFFDVSMNETLHFSVFDKDFATRDDPIGSLDISIRQLAASTADNIAGTMRQWFKLENVEHGDIQLKLQYIPMDTVHRFGA